MNKLCLLLLCCIVILRATGQPGSLDPAFGNNGIQTTAFFTNLNLLSEEGRVVLTGANGDIFVVIQISSSLRIAKYLPDGKLDSSYGIAGYSNVVELYVTGAVLQEDKILVAGHTYNNDSYDDFALVRYTADGALDSSFGENGIIATDFNNSYDGATCIVLQGDKIIVAGYAGADFALARYTADGALDNSFGVNGKVNTHIADYGKATSIVLQGDKIVVAGNAEEINDDWGYSVSDFALARYTTDGILDSSFGKNGIVITDIGSDYDQANSIALQGDKIVVAGSIAFFNYDFALARYTSDGDLDLSFGENGIVTIDFNSHNRNDKASSVTVLGDKIIVAGYADDINNDFGEDFALARYNTDGTLDSSFGVNGKVTTDFNNSYDKVTSMILQGDKIIVGGYAGNPNSNYDFALARYMADGKLDSSFGKNGKLTGYLPSAGITYFRSTVIQGNKIVAAGYAINDNNGSSDFALARYTVDGALDSSFGVNGKVTTNITDYDEATSVILQGDKIIVAGNAFNYESNWDIALARYTADGRLDSTFGENGIVTTDFDNSYDYANSIALQGDKIVVAGQTYTNDDSYYDFALARYTADGRLDSSFGKNGIVITSFSPDTDGATSIAVQGDKIIVAGYGYTPNLASSWDFALARYTVDGALDSSFGENGKVLTDFNNSSDEVQSIILQGDKIVVAGETSYDDFALARYSADGKLDSSFGVNGRVTTDFGYQYERANSMALQGDKIIVGGSGNGDFALARYSADGTLDSSFGENGKTISHLGGYSFLGEIALHQNRLYAAGSLSIATGETYGLVAAYQLEAPAPTISIADVTVQESKKLAVVTVRLSAPANQIVRVHFTIRNKTATGNHDYVTISGPLFFIPGLNNTTAKIFIPIIDDNQYEGTEQFEIVLTNAHNATIQDSVGVVTIMDDDAPLVTKQESTSLHIHVSPNPSANAFTVQLQSSNLKQPASIRIYDVNGRLLEQRNNISIGQSFHLGDQYKAGTYIIEAMQESQSVQTKVVKTGK